MLEINSNTSEVNVTYKYIWVIRTRLASGWELHELAAIWLCLSGCCQMVIGWLLPRQSAWCHPQVTGYSPEHPVFHSADFFLKCAFLDLWVHSGDLLDWARWSWISTTWRRRVLVTPENHRAARVWHIHSGSLGEGDLLRHSHNRRHCLVRVDSMWIDEGTHLTVSDKDRILGSNHDGHCSLVCWAAFKQKCGYF